MYELDCPDGLDCEYIAAALQPTFIGSCPVQHLRNGELALRAFWILDRLNV